MPDSSVGQSVSPVLDAEERQAMDDLLAAYNRICGWGLRVNQSELTTAVHAIQGFITQHMLRRVAPEHWSAWFVTVTEEAVPDA